MPTTTVDQVLLDSERSYWQALKDKDNEAIVRLTHDPCIVAGPQGTARVERAQLVKMMGTKPWSVEEFELKDAQVEFLRDDVGIVAYAIHEKLIVDGKPVTLDAFHTSTWVRRDGTWQCAAHTESLPGDPYGRDQRR